MEVASRRWPGGSGEQFVVAEEAAHFDGGGLGAVAGVADVDHLIDAEVPADGAGIGFPGVGGAEQFADAGDGIFSLQRDGDDGAALHERDDFRKERPIGDMGVVFLEEIMGERHHFDAAEPEPLAGKAAEHLADEVFGDAIGFAEDEGGFQGHESKTKGDGGDRGVPVAGTRAGEFVSGEGAGGKGFVIKHSHLPCGGDRGES